MRQFVGGFLTPALSPAEGAKAGVRGTGGGTIWLRVAAVISRRGRLRGRE
jgi:hypothetical protein